MLFERLHSRASPLPHSTAFQRWNPINVGAGLAREEALTGARNPGSDLSCTADCLPHSTAFQRWNPVKCGSGLAREEAHTGARNPGSDLFVQLTASHIRPHSKGGTRSMWERACPRRGPYRRPQPRIRPFCTTDSLPHSTALQRWNPINVGAGLAREEALTGARNPGSDLVVQLTTSHIRLHSKGETRSMWERACPRRGPYRRPQSRIRPFLYS